MRLFQRQQGLLDDGVVGEQTILALNAALGLDPSSLAIRERMSSEGPVQ